MRLLLLPIIFLLLSACSAKYHLRKAEQHLKKAEIKGAIISQDTVYVDVVTQRTITDTVQVVKDNFFTDTITVETVRWKSRLKIDTLTRTIYQQVECKPDTLKVPVQIIRDIKTGWPWWYIVVAALCGVGLGVLITILRK